MAKKPTTTRRAPPARPPKEPPHKCEITMQTWCALFLLAIAIVVGCMGGSWALTSKQMESQKELAKAQSERMEQMFATAQTRRDEMIGGIHEIQRSVPDALNKVLVRLSEVQKPQAPSVSVPIIDPATSK